MIRKIQSKNLVEITFFHPGEKEATFLHFHLDLVQILKKEARFLTNANFSVKYKILFFLKLKKMNPFLNPHFSKHATEKPSNGDNSFSAKIGIIAFN